MNILQKIFNEHYEEIQYILHPRPVVMENIEKMINCGDPSYLLDMHYFLTEDDDLDDEFKEGFYIDLF